MVISSVIDPITISSNNIRNFYYLHEYDVLINLVYLKIPYKIFITPGKEFVALLLFINFHYSRDFIHKLCNNLSIIQSNCRIFVI